MLRPYLGMIRISLLGFFQYIGWFWSTLFSVTIGLLVYIFLWKAILANAISEMPGFSNDTQFITFITVSFLINRMMNSNMAGNLSNLIREGMIATQLARPVRLLPFLACEDIGIFIVNIITLFIPIFIVVLFSFQLLLPSSILQIMMFLLSLIFGFLVFLSYSVFMGLFVFVTESWWGLSQLSMFIVTFFSGALVPISIMPKILRTIASFLPFQTSVTFPTNIYIHAMSIQEVLPYFLIQIAWIVGILLVTSFVWKRWIVRNIVVNGG